MKLRFWNKNPTKKTNKKEDIHTSIDMITTTDHGFYMYNGKIYQSDIIRACIRPQVKALGKMVAKHIKETRDGIKVNETPYIRFLLEEPNQFMTNQVMIEKVITQLELNSNAFIYISRDKNGLANALYPINCVHVTAQFDNGGNLWLEFTLKNGSRVKYHYGDIIHLRNDFNTHDIFGDSPHDVLKPLMEIVNTTDQGIVKAIKNSNVISWLLTFKQSLREEDKDKAVKDFTSKYLDVDSDTGGALATDPKFEAKQVEPKSYVPNALVIDRNTQRLYNFYNTNEKIIQNKYNEDDWNAFYEGKLEPIAIQLSQEYTRKIFSRKQRLESEYIMFEASNLQYASLDTKLKLVSLVDRGGMTNNEWRKYLNLPPVEGGDELIRRLDTAVIRGGDK